MNRFASHRDGNHNAIVEELTKRGYAVLDLSRMGKGCPDILVSTESQMWLIEIKLPGKKLEQNQEKFHKAWKGKPIHTVHSAKEALEVLCG